LVTFILPNTYASTARILPAVTEPGVVATQVEILRSKHLLLQVVTNLNLPRKYADTFKFEEELSLDLAYSLLLTRTVVKQAKDTCVIETTVFSQNPVEAAGIANEIALTYVNSPLAARGADGKAVPTIIDNATPARRPVRPNKFLNIGCGIGVGGILALVGVWLILNREFRGLRPSGHPQGIMPGGAPPPLP